MVFSMEMVGALRVRSHSLTRESWDALGPGSGELISILTSPNLTGVPPTNEYGNLRKTFIANLCTDTVAVTLNNNCGGKTL